MRIGSEVTRRTPPRPRATRLAKKLLQAAPVSLVATRMPSTSRWPSPLTPVASRTTALMTRPPSQTFIVNASAETNVNGPASSRGRWRTPHARRDRLPCERLKSSPAAATSNALAECFKLPEPAILIDLYRGLPRNHTDLIRPALPIGGKLRHQVRLVGGQIVPFHAVVLDVVEFPVATSLAHELMGSPADLRITYVLPVLGCRL